MDPQNLTRDSRGFTLVEVMISLVILVGGLVALAQGSVQMVNQVNVSDVRMGRIVARQSATEQLKAMPFDSLAVTTPTATVGDFTMTWAITGTTVNSRVLEVVTSGPGLDAGSTPPQVSATVVDTVEIRIVRP